ncbi:MAG: glycine--tRNA ligase, partial [Clostridia bacterium]|nr:glycine--tRNA ligase [Clostridia bacterium]
LSGTYFNIVPYGVSEETGMVTVRDRDTMEQTHVAIDELTGWLESKMEF